MYQYSFANVDLILQIPDAEGNYKRTHIKGFNSGENLINIQRRAPIASVQFSAFGDMITSMQRIKAADLMFPTFQNAPENKALQDYANYFQAQADADGALIFPIQGKMTDNMGKDEAILQNGIILAMPAMVRGQRMSLVNWVITFENGLLKREKGGDFADLGV